MIILSFFFAALCILFSIFVFSPLVQCLIFSKEFHTQNALAVCVRLLLILWLTFYSLPVNLFALVYLTNRRQHVNEGH